MSRYSCVESIIESLPYKSTILAINYNTLCRPDLIVTRLAYFIECKDNSFDAIIIHKNEYIKILHKIDRILKKNGICVIISDESFEYIAWKYKYKPIHYWIIDKKSAL